MMKKKVLTTLILIVCVCIAYAQSHKAGPFPDRIILTWSADPASTQSVTWRTDSTVQKGFAQVMIEGSSPKLEKPDAKEYTALVSSLKGAEYERSNYHSVTFTELKADQLYTYRVGDGTNWSEWFQFKTAPAVTKPFSFIYLGDA